MKAEFIPHQIGKAELLEKHLAEGRIKFPKAVIMKWGINKGIRVEKPIEHMPLLLENKK